MGHLSTARPVNEARAGARFCENLLRLRRAVLETEGPWPASQFPISTKKLGSNPALSFQRLVSKESTLTVFVFLSSSGVRALRNGQGNAWSSRASSFAPHVHVQLYILR